MRVGALAEMVGRDLRRSLRTFTVAALGIAVGIATLTFFLALSEGMRRVVLGRIFPVDRIEVVPREFSAGSEVGPARRSGGIEPSALDALRRIPGVRAVYPKMRLLFPSSGRGGAAIFGRNLGAGELVADGIDPALVRGDLVPGATFDDPAPRATNAACRVEIDCVESERCDTPLDAQGNVSGPGVCSPPIPGLISPYLVEVFNGAIAPSHHIRGIDPAVLRQSAGLELEWDLGRAGLGTASQGQQRRRHVRIVGISNRALDLGLTVPLDVARRLNREYAGAEADARFTSAVLELTSPTEMAAVSARARGMDLEVRNSGAEQVGLLVALITAILSLTSVIVVVVASLNIAHVFFTLIAERRGEIGLLRALGASRGDVRALVLGQAATVGVMASVMGVGLARLAAWGCDHLARTRLPAFPFKPDHWFVFAPGTLGAVLGFGVAACLLSALAPAARAARVEPATALAGGL